MTVTILFSGKYPGYGAASNRVRLYHKALTENGIKTEIVSIYRATTGRIQFYWWLFISPAFLFLQIFRLPGNNNIVLAYTDGFISCLVIWLATRLRGMKLILEINEKPFTPYGNKLTELRLIKWLNIALFQHITVYLPDGFIAISQNLYTYLNKFVSAKKIFKVPIIVDSSEMRLESRKLKLILQKPYLLHAGALSERKDGIIGVFEAFALANKQLEGGLHFYLTDQVAPTNIKQSISEIIAKNNLEEKVHFLGAIAKEELLTYQKECTMLILNKPDNEQNRYNFPTKLGEYLALGKPIIYTPVGEITHYLNNQNAFEVPIGNSQKLSEMIIKIIQNYDLIQQTAANGHRLADTVFNYHYQGERLAGFLNKFSIRNAQ